jgi:hypothetical protein
MVGNGKALHIPKVAMKWIGFFICVALLAGMCGCKRRAEKDTGPSRSTVPGVKEAAGVAIPVVDANTAHKSNFTISKETTYVTGPVDKDGYIDYAAALHERLSKGVTPETNANLLIWKALGPKPDGKPMPPEYFKLMGMDMPPAEGEYFIDLRSFLRDRLKIADPETIRRIEDQAIRTRESPWSLKEYPEIGQWLAANEKPLDLFVEGTRRPNFYSPVVQPQGEQGNSGIISAGLTTIQHFRTLSNALTSRVKRKLNDGQIEEAWSDALAIHRLARMVGRSGLMIEGIVALALEVIAQQVALAFLERLDVDAKQIEKFFKDVNVLPPLTRTADMIDGGERLFFLNGILDASRSEVKDVGGLTDDERKELDDYKKVNWDPALRNANLWLDRLATGLRKPELAERKLFLDEMEQKLNRATELPNAAKVPAAEALSNIFLSGSLATVRRVQNATDRAEQSERNLHLAFALAAYQRDNKLYPKSLDALVPKYLDKLPYDLFTGKPLVYRPNENGYLLYSLGPDGKDDEGRGQRDTPKGDDIAVRMPALRPAKK